MPEPAPAPQHTRPTFLIVASIIVVVIFATSFLLKRLANVVEANGQALPRIALQPLDEGGRERTATSLEGKVVLLNFWGTWCYPCRVELPELIELAEEFEGRSDFVFLPVSCPNSPGSDIEVARQETAEFLEDQGFDLQCYYDARATTRLAVSETMGLGGNFGYPTTLVLDRENRIRGFWQGYSPKVIAEQRKLLRTLLQP